MKQSKQKLSIRLVQTALVLSIISLFFTTQAPLRITQDGIAPYILTEKQQFNAYFPMIISLFAISVFLMFLMLVDIMPNKATAKDNFTAPDILNFKVKETKLQTNPIT